MAARVSTLGAFALGISLTINAQADTLSNAESLFAFAEATYPELLTPPAPETQALQGYYVRFYAESGIYLGVQGDNIWALGPQFGDAVIYVGKLEELITVPERDISNALLTNRRAECTYYADKLVSSVLDLQRSRQFSGSLTITVDPTAEQCVFQTNSIPNHDFNDASAAFATAVSPVAAEFRIPVQPAFAAEPTALSLTTDNAILLNGVKVDLLAAACYGVADEKIGCNDINQPWRFDPMSPLNQFGTDLHNAHTQPDGTYHYHGNPEALFADDPVTTSPVVGFAADGFPIFGSYIEDGGAIRAVRSSYRLNAGSRPSGPNDPGGTYDGRFVDDYEYLAGSGDLDACNGMMRDGIYGYYVIDEYPWVLACFQGTPDSSFAKAIGGGGGQQAADPGAPTTESPPDSPTTEG